MTHTITDTRHAYPPLHTMIHTMTNTNSHTMIHTMKTTRWHTHNDTQWQTYTRNENPGQKIQTNINKKV